MQAYSLSWTAFSPFRFDSNWTNLIPALAICHQPCELFAPRLPLYPSLLPARNEQNTTGQSILRWSVTPFSCGLCCFKTLPFSESTCMPHVVKASPAAAAVQASPKVHCYLQTPFKTLNQNQEPPTQRHSHSWSSINPNLTKVFSLPSVMPPPIQGRNPLALPRNHSSEESCWEKALNNQI